ncbi:hypothetical protein DFH94DRAFT_674372 [Russula ochroleuca]|uniref:ubiquitinyl hydrolase 1 n=1 Tax=Russula ochroleuca TaxID=152965 RepID=A0A9P5JZR4_9AGAM|nr:hypothetical protein DFH94DRAFT_674372 [Russula ochroleuca]
MISVQCGTNSSKKQGSEGITPLPSTFFVGFVISTLLCIKPSSYPSCNIAGHRSNFATHVPVAMSSALPLPTQPGDSLHALPHQSTPGGSPALRLAEEANIITGLLSPPDQTTVGEIGGTSQPPAATFPVPSGSFSSDRSPQGGITTSQPDTTSAATLSQPLESIRQGDLATPSAAPLADISEISSDNSPAFISKTSHPASSGGFSAPDSPLPPHVPPFPNEELLSLLSGTSQKGPFNAALPHLHPHRLVNNGNMYVANAVLQLLVYCPPFRDLFRDLGRLVGRREGGETDGGATPLIDATVRFLDEFTHKEKLSPTHQFLQQATRGKVREDEHGKKEDDGVHPFLSTYVFDAMKKKRQFITIRDGEQQDATVFLGLYLDALDEELVALRSSFSTHKPASTLKVEGPEEETQSGDGQTEVGERDYMASSVESPISRVFGGRSRSTVRALNQPDTVIVEDWRSLKLNIQVRFPFLSLSS